MLMRLLVSWRLHPSTRGPTGCRFFSGSRYVDACAVHVQAGSGGRGCTSFAREANKRVAAPDGGNGGNGGSVLFRAASNASTLSHLEWTYRSANGSPGLSSCRHGRSGSDVVIDVPIGTTGRCKESGTLLFDFTADAQEKVVARGGRGGCGNRVFATSSNRSPEDYTPGKPGEALDVSLELRSLAEVGLVGLPNAGKSSLLGALSTARPEVASYPFTTLHPSVGLMEHSEYREPVTVSDIPGIVDGAHAGRGLGIRFLRHVQRTSLLVLVLDLAVKSRKTVGDGQSSLPAWSAFDVLHKELLRFDAALLERPFIIAANKMDSDASHIHFGKLLNHLEKRGVFPDVVPVSVHTGQGIEKLKELIESNVERVRVAGRKSPPQPAADGLRVAATAD